MYQWARATATKGKDQGSWHRGTERNDGHQGAHTGRARHNKRTSTALPPAKTARPPEAHARQDAPPKHGLHAARTPPAHAHRPPDPAQGMEGTHPHGEKGPHLPREPPRTPPRSPPPRLHRRATTPAAARANTQATAQAPEEEEDTAATPKTRGKDPQRTQDQGTGPQEGQPRGRPPDPPTRTAHPDPCSMDPTSHITPRPQLPASHITSARVPHGETGQSNQRGPHQTPERQ